MGTSAQQRSDFRQPRFAWVLLALLTALGFALRLDGHQQSLNGDEYYAQTIITASHGVVSLLHHVNHSVEATPPMYFFLGWIARKFDPSLAAIRIPSLIAGTALIPTVFILGRRLAGWQAGLLAAALVAISPFGIWYSNEARAYAVLALLCALVMLQALRLVERPTWWNSVLLGAVSTAVLYTHNTGAFVLLATLGWIFVVHPPLRARITVIALATGVLYLPFILTFAPRDIWWMFGHLYGQGPTALWTSLERMALGSAYIPLRTVPGPVGLLLVASCVGVGIFTLRRRFPAADSPIALAVTVVVTTTTGLFAYAFATNVNIFATRTMNTMFAAAMVLLAVVIAKAVPARLAAVMAAVTLGVFGWSTATALQAKWLRPDVKGAAAAAAGLRPQPKILMPNGYRYRNYLPANIADSTAAKELSLSQWAGIAPSVQALAWINVLLPTGETRGAIAARTPAARGAGFTVSCSKIYPGYPPVLLQIEARPNTRWAKAPDCSATAQAAGLALAPLERRNVRVLPAGSSPSPDSADILALVALLSALAALLAWLIRGGQRGSRPDRSSLAE